MTINSTDIKYLQQGSAQEFQFSMLSYQLRNVNCTCLAHYLNMFTVVVLRDYLLQVSRLLTIQFTSLLSNITMRSEDKTPNTTAH